MDNPDDISTLEQDSSLSEPLRRVAYEAGMMLGLEATRDEQTYHRRRLNRHQYWLHGYGTLAGMVVSISPESVSEEVEKLSVRLLVSPGIGIDGLGREVLIQESYCINLGDWLDAQSESHLREGYSDADNLLWLKVCVRQKDCPVAKQPVLARKLNLSTDAVQPSRIADSVQLDLIPELPAANGDDAYQPWAHHQAIADDLPALSEAEQAMITQLENDGQQVAAAQLRLHARLLHALDNDSIDARQLIHELENDARLLLARISIPVADINDLSIDPATISINNLVRPFLATASQLAWLARQPISTE